ncbi:hypothetical protein BIU82_09405 [Arthrobacter sp. SW1]|uniref:O-antigen ligase family protein n=1 Tax=Arthrobacter sp. SW1 TaxID=1920889 RepID=UPI000877E916|nr:O-antigen ligase family protein [Arthrobacter sp. SW1]OFI37290.1 hypothetical protein BIU82_09405 [Arthrobacter sp. SW1]
MLRYALLAGAALTALLTGFLMTDPVSGGRIVAAAVIGLPWFVYFAFKMPMVLFHGLAVILGFLPFGVVPGSSLPLVFVASLGAGFAAMLLPRSQAPRYSLLDWAVVFMLAMGVFSAAVTYVSPVDLTELSKWLVAGSVTMSLRRLSEAQRLSFGRSYVYTSTAAAGFGLVSLAFDGGGAMMKPFAVFGYVAGNETLRYVYDGDEQTRRLTGTYVDPNAGGLFLLLAIFLALALLAGWKRMLSLAILGTAILLTLSRAAIFSVVVALLLYLAMKNMKLHGRMKFLSVMVLGLASAFAIPEVQERVFDSFGKNDSGSEARQEALENFPRHVEDHWIFGLGWGRPEFRDADIGWAVNYVANAPLLSIYRGGLVAGLAFWAVLLIGVYLSFRALRHPRADLGFLGAGFIGLVFVALQLDFPVVTIAPVTTVLSIYLAFLPRPAELATTEDPPPLAEPAPEPQPAVVGPLYGRRALRNRRTPHGRITRPQQATTGTKVKA